MCLDKFSCDSVMNKNVNILFTATKKNMEPGSAAGVGAMPVLM